VIVVPPEGAGVGVGGGVGDVPALPLPHAIVNAARAAMAAAARICRLLSLPSSFAVSCPVG
jgi:hypothetical protein